LVKTDSSKSNNDDDDDDDMSVKSNLCAMQYSDKSF